MPREKVPIKRREEGGPPKDRQKPLPVETDPMEDLREFYKDNEQDLDTREPSGQ